MIIRELLTSLGIDFDTKGADEADRRVSKLQNALETLGTVVTFGGVFAGLKSVVGMASDAEQTLSKLRLNFEENTQGVLDWADATAKATGESKYTLREFAGTFGSMLVPTLNFDRKKAAEWSETLSAMAVDLAAINNEKPEETMQRLFSGMTGSSEAVERLGINIKQLALQEFAQTKGITTKVTKMSVAQKAELIYAKMIADTRDKLGAAAAESKSYAGLTLRLGSALKDTGTAIGQKLIPYASEFVGLFLRGVGVLGEWAQDSDKLTAALVALGSIMGAMAVRLIIMNLPLIAFGAGIALVILAVEDLLKAFSGGKSAIGTFMEMLIGDKVWDRISKLPGKLGDIMFEMGLTPEQKKQRGIGFEQSTNIWDFLAPLMGEDPAEWKKKISGGLQKSTRDFQTVGPSADMMSSGGGSFVGDLFSSPWWKKDLNQSLMTPSTPATFGFGGQTNAPVVNQTNNITVQGDATPDTVMRMREQLDDHAQSLYYSTPTTDPDYSESLDYARGR